MKQVTALTRLMLILLPILASSTGWNSIVTTTAEVDPEDYGCIQTEIVEMDQMVNSNGLHIVVADDDGILYKRFNSGGTLQASTVVSSQGYYPNIVGDENNLYIVYFTGSYLFVMKSSNNGTSWTSNGYFPFSNSTCSGIDVAFDGTHIHVAYGKGDETYYRRNTGGTWYDYKHVSDETSGGGPQIALSDDRIHVSWNTDPTPFYCDGQYTLTRDKYDGDWEDEQEVSGELWNTSSGEDLIVVDDELHLLFFLPGTSSHPLYHTFRDVSEDVNDWSTEVEVDDIDLAVGATKEIAGVTDDGTLHVVGGESGGLFHYTYNGSAWSTGTEIDGTIWGKWYTMESNSNDLYVFWIKYDAPDYTIQYRQYDANPLAPTGLSVTASGGHPYLTWNANKETDLAGYHVYSMDEDDNVTRATTNPITATNYLDTDFTIGWAVPVTYFVKAIDVEDNLSGASNTDEIWVLPKRSAPEEANVTPLAYALYAAYPNPFNPVTTIRYDLPAEAQVEVNIYDVEGKLVSNLVRAHHVGGEYSVQWQGKTESGMSLPGGVYICRIQAGDYTAKQKMILLK